MFGSRIIISMLSRRSPTGPLNAVGAEVMRGHNRDLNGRHVGKESCSRTSSHESTQRHPGDSLVDFATAWPMPSTLGGLTRRLLGAWPGRRVFLACRVLQHSHALHGDQRAASDHLVEDREQSVNMRLIVDDLNHDG